MASAGAPPPPEKLDAEAAAEAKRSTAQQLIGTVKKLFRLAGHPVKLIDLKEVTITFGSRGKVTITPSGNVEIDKEVDSSRHGVVPSAGRITNEGEPPMTDQRTDPRRQDRILPDWAEVIDRQPGIVIKNNYLVQAAGDGSLELVRRFLDMGAEVGTHNNDALRSAAANGYTDIVKFLMDKGADVHAAKDEALIIAAQRGHTDTVRFLLESNPAEEARKKALQLATQRGRQQIAQMLT
jgi:hypothetical protein